MLSSESRTTEAARKGADRSKDEVKPQASNLEVLVFLAIYIRSNDFRQAPDTLQSAEDFAHNSITNPRYSFIEDLA